MKIIPSFKNSKVNKVAKYLDDSIALLAMDSPANDKEWVARYELFIGGNIISTSELLDPNTTSIVNASVIDNVPLIDLDVNNLLANENLPPNNYDVKIHLHRRLDRSNQVGRSFPVSFYVKEISPKRDEVVLGVHDPLLIEGNSLQAQNTINKYWVRARVLIQNNIGLKNKVFVFENGDVYNVINQRVDDVPRSPTTLIGKPSEGTLVLKLSRPLVKSIGNGDLCILEQQVTPTRQVKVKIQAQPIPNTNYKMKLPDFSVPAGSTSAPTSTKFESWSSLLGSNTETKNRLLNSVFSSSTAHSANLGIDYRKYSNFVHFSSANERLENFKYKIQLIEYYDTKLTALSSATSSTISANKTNYINKKNKIIGSFDGYENYLYYESSSYESSSYGIFNASTWPKTTSNKPYVLASVNSSAVTSWLATQSAAALDYDIDNDYNLEKTVPDHIRLDSQNANYLMFVNMCGQHYDQLYNYVDHLTKIHDRTNDLDIGISKDIIWDTLKSLGWNGINGYNFEDLWSYNLGSDETGAYQTTESGSTQTFVVSSSMPTSDITKEIWLRTLNNLPYILKTKGTERSIRALTNIYGLPPTVLRVREYGGAPKDMSTNQYIKYEQFNQSLVFGSGEPYLKLPWGQLSNSVITQLPSNAIPPSVIEFRLNCNTPQNSIIMHQHAGNNATNWQIELEKHPSASNASSGYYNHGRVWSYIRHGSTISTDFSGSATSWAPIFDNDWWNIQFGINDANYSSTYDQTFRLDLWKAPDHAKGIVTHKYHSTNSIDNQSNWRGYTSPVIVGYGNGTQQAQFVAGAYESNASNRLQGFTGSIQEIRYWAFNNDARLTDAAFTNHVLSPLSIEGNTYTASYTDLVYRLPLGSDNKAYTLTNGTKILSAHPNQNKLDIFKSSSGYLAYDVNSGSAYNFTGTSADWQYEEESYFTVVPEIIGSRAISDKIRIESGSITGELKRAQSIVSSSIELASVDSPMLGIYYSPVDDIDIDISHQIGGAKFDDFVGNPRDAYRTKYKELNHIRNHYWSKYNTSPTFGAYLKVLKYFDHSIFKQAESLVPGRAKDQTGLMIKPNLLERPTIVRVSESFENRTFGMSDLVANKVDYKFSKETMDLGFVSNQTYDGSIHANNKTYLVYDRDLSQKANSNLVNSFDESAGGDRTIGGMASQDVPTYDSSVVSKKYTQKTSGSNSGPVAVQDFVPTAIKNQRYGGTKYGSINGSIGGIINLVNDPTVTGTGLFDNTTTDNIKCAIEVVETNAIELEVTERTINSRGDITLR